MDADAGCLLARAGAGGTVHLGTHPNPAHGGAAEGPVPEPAPDPEGPCKRGAAHGSADAGVSVVTCSLEAGGGPAMESSMPWAAGDQGGAELAEPAQLPGACDADASSGGTAAPAEVPEPASGAADVPIDASGEHTAEVYERVPRARGSGTRPRTDAPKDYYCDGGPAASEPPAGEPLRAEKFFEGRWQGAVERHVWECICWTMQVLTGLLRVIGASVRAAWEC